MTLAIDLAPEQEARLTRLAQERGIPVRTCVQKLLEQALDTETANVAGNGDTLPTEEKAHSVTTPSERLIRGYIVPREQGRSDDGWEPYGEEEGDLSDEVLLSIPEVFDLRPLTEARIRGHIIREEIGQFDVGADGYVEEGITEDE